MKVTINNVTAEGTPKEVFNLLMLMGQAPTKPHTPKSPFTYVAPPMYSPIISTTMTPPTTGSTSYTIPTKYHVPVSLYWTTE